MVATAKVAGVAGATVSGAGVVVAAMTFVSAAVAAAANKPFRDVVTGPSFWEALGKGDPSAYLQDRYGITIGDLINALWEALTTGKISSLEVCPKDFQEAKRWQPPRDPIILDLGGDGLQTVGLSGNVYFDHDGDGVLSKTGWVGQGDALLVWDRNANGRIDSGAELFGDFTPLPNGSLAPNGFAALAALDSNGDGVLDAADPAFAELKLWKDSTPNGQTEAGELITLTDAGISALNLAPSLKNQNIGNGNTPPVQEFIQNEKTAGSWIFLMPNTSASKLLKC